MKKALAFLLALLLFSSFCLSSSAEIPYTGYSYDEWNVAIPSTVGYRPTKVHYGDAELKTRFNAPEDMFIAEDGTVYLLDAGDNRVVVLDNQFKLIKTIDMFTLPDGTGYSLLNPKGIFVRDGLIYVADYDNMSVIVSDIEGKIRLKLTKPENQIFPVDSEFRPMRILVDSEGNIYVLVLGIYQGAAVFNAKGDFIDFYGSNTVIPTVNVLIDKFWKRILSKEQESQISNYVPVQFTSFDITKDDFVYSCTSFNADGISELRYINPMGRNLWNDNAHGDLEVGWYKNKSFYTNFVDVAVTEDDFLFALDSTKGRVFLYDPEGYMVFVFGGKSAQKGTFTQPTAVDTYGNKVLVLDKVKRSITVFEPTEYGEKVIEAMRLFVDGNYAASQKLWETVLKQDSNLFTAYVGIGKAMYYSGKYKESIAYFRKGKDRESESKAFKEYRSAVLRASFPYIMSCGSALFVITISVIIVRRKRSKKTGDEFHA